MSVVDFDTKIISPTQKLWLVHPGLYRKYFQTFKNNNMVFLSMPGLQLTKTTGKKVETIRQHIRMAKSLKRFYEDSSGKMPEPSDSPEDYDDAPGRDVTGDVGNVLGLYYVAAPGDLVVVTAKGQYEPLLIGEIDTQFDPKDTSTAKGLEYAEVQYRRVRWIHKNKYSKRDFNRDLAESLVNRKAVIQLPKDKHTQQLYEFAYSSYVIGDKSKVDLYGPSYNGHDPSATNSSTTLVSYLAAAYCAIEKDELNKFKKLTIRAAIEKYPASDLIQNFYHDFQSPGKFVLFTVSAGLAAFINLGITTMASGATTAQVKGIVKVRNSAENKVDDSLKDACKKYNYLIQSLGDDKICDMQKLGEDGKQKIGLKTIAKIKFND